MRRLGWGLAVLWLGATVSVASAQGPRYRHGPDNGLLTGLFAPAKPKEEPKPPPRKDTGKAANPLLAREQNRLLQAYLDRCEVCIKLEQIAEATGNDALGEEAKQLQDMAWNVYEEQMRRLQARAASAPEAAAAPKGQARPDRGALPSRFRAGGLNPSEPDRMASGGEGTR